MLKVIIPVAVLLLIVLCKKLPVVGGKINVALVVTGALTLLLGGLFNPAEWIAAWIDGMNRLSWIIALSIAGSLFAEISMRMGTIDTIIGALTAKFGRHPRLLIVCILFALTLAGSLLGDAIAASTVIGMLTIGILVSMNMSAEKISAIIVMGACVGSIMPPMTQAVALACSLTGAEVDPVINISYITVSVIFFVVAVYCAMFLVKKENVPGANPSVEIMTGAEVDPVINISYITVSVIFFVVAVYCAMFLVKKENVPGANPSVEIKFMDKRAGEILRENWKSLIPLIFLIVIVLLRTVKIPYISVDLGPTILKNINILTMPDGSILNLYDWLSNVSILNGLSNGIVLSILCAIAVAFLFPAVHQNTGIILRESLSKVKMTVVLQICARWQHPESVRLAVECIHSEWVEQWHCAFHSVRDCGCVFVPGGAPEYRYHSQREPFQGENDSCAANLLRVYARQLLRGRRDCGCVFVPGGAPEYRYHSQREPFQGENDSCAANLLRVYARQLLRGRLD